MAMPERLCDKCITLGTCINADDAVSQASITPEDGLSDDGLLKYYERLLGDPNCLSGQLTSSMMQGMRERGISPPVMLKIKIIQRDLRDLLKN